MIGTNLRSLTRLLAVRWLRGIGFGVCLLSIPNCSSNPSSTSNNAGGSSGAASSTGGFAGAAQSSTSGGTKSTGGTQATGGSSAAATGGAIAAGGSAGCAPADQGGKALAKPGDKTSANSDYLNLCNARLLNNNWGSVAIQKAGTSCSAPESVQVNSDSSLGWTFNRGNCGDDGSHPDFPELEFGVAPFGSGSSLLTSPAFSSTTLLPIQVKNITSASVTINNLAISLQSAPAWDLGVEFWLSTNNPVTSADGGVYAEIMALWGWNTNFWACTAGLSGSVTSGSNTYRLCHQSNTWNSPSTPTWRFFQFEYNGGSVQSFNGTVDIKAFLDWFYSSSYGSGASKDLWLTRIEIGSEIDDSTSGTCTLRNITYNINGTSQSPVLGH